METAITFSLSLPKSWAELTTAQQIYVYFLLSEGYDAAAIRSFCLLRWSGIKVLAAQARNNYLVQYDGKQGFLSAWQRVLHRAAHREISDSVLMFTAQCLVYAGSALGINVYINSKFSDIKKQLTTNHPKEDGQSES